MEISGIEKLSRYFVILALVAVMVAAGLIVYGKMRGSKKPVPVAAVMATPRPKGRPAQVDDSGESAPADGQPVGAGSFQSGSLAIPAPAVENDSATPVNQ